MRLRLIFSSKFRLKYRLSILKEERRVEKAIRNLFFHQLFEEDTSKVHKILRRFNLAVESKDKKQNSLSERWLKIIPKRRKIVIDSTLLNRDEERVQSIFSPSPLLASGEISDLFRMKAISLFRENKISYLGVQQTLDEIRKNPIFMQQDSLTGSVTLQQKYVPFPGETVIVTGKLRKDPVTLRHLPVQDSFELMTHSSQRAYPHPSQHVGFGVPEQLLLPCLHFRVGSCLLDLFEKRNSVMTQFPLNRAIQIFKARKADFESDLVRSCRLFQKLIEVLIGGKDKRVTDFLESLQKRSDPYLYLSKVHEEINLLPSWNELSKRGFNISIKTSMNPETRAYQKLLHSYLFPSYCEIVKQSLSFISQSRFSPLSPLSLKLQSSAYLHLESFLEELEADHTLSWESLIRRDISLFEGDYLTSFTEELNEALLDNSGRLR